MANYEDDQHSLIKKAAVLTGIVGAAAFLKKGGGKYISRGLPEVGKFANKLTNEMSGMRFKDFDASNIKRIYKNTFDGVEDSFKEIKEGIPKTIKINTDGNNPLSAIIRSKELEANGRRLAEDVFNTGYSERVSKALGKKYGLESDDFINNLNDLVSRGIKKDDLVLYRKGDSVTFDTELIDSYLDPDKYDLGANRNNFFSDLLGSLENRENEFRDYLSEHTNDRKEIDLIKNITDELTGEKFAETYGVVGDTINDDVLKAGLGGRAATLDDFVNNDTFEDTLMNINGEQVSLKDTVREFIDKDELMRDVMLDSKNIKINADGEIINFQAIDEARKNLLHSFAGTLPGKIFKVTDSLSKEDPGSINFYKKGKFNPLANNDGTVRGKDNLVQVLNKFYRINDDNSLEHLSDLDGMRSRSSKHGSKPRMYSKMFGAEAEYEVTNKYAKWFDVGTTTESTIIEKMAREDGLLGKAFKSVTGAKSYNVIDKVRDEALMRENPIEYRKHLESLNTVFSNISKAPSKNTISKMRNTVDSELSKEILDALMSNDKEDIVQVLLNNSDSIKNKDLISLAKTGSKDRERAARMLSIKSNKLTSSKNVLKYKDMIRREAFKEVMLLEATNEVSGSSNYSKAIAKLKNSGLTKSEYENARKLTHWISIQHKGDLFSNSRRDKDIDKAISDNINIFNFINDARKEGSIPTNATYKKDLNEALDSIKSNFNDASNRTELNPRASKRKRAVEHNDMMLYRPGYDSKSYVKDMLSDMNNATKMRANSKKFFGQFVAGRDNPNLVTSYTDIPFFFTQRLTEPFAEYGLGFSNKNTKSVLDLWKNIGLKRVLPAAGAITAFSYLNYEAKNITGTSITGAMAQGIANVDLGIRKIADATGVGALLEAERKINPMTQYWFGEDYQNSTERKDYYENGYDAVRKGRWWAFGSASEFRGSKITYFQPNFVKRANSDWRDIGIYGSSKEKWKHSWIPTPRHPLAPIRRLLDPYWLEKKNMDDRPFMTTAPLFSAGTPWGAVLNPTIGEMIKPVKRMHRNEVRRGLTDPRTLIQNRNERIKAKAVDKERQNLISISDEGVGNISYTPLALADPSKAILNFRMENGRLRQTGYNGVDYPENISDLRESRITQGKHAGEGEGDVLWEGPGYKEQESFIGNVLDVIQSTSIGSALFADARRMSGSVNIIGGINNSTMKRATSSDGVTLKQTSLAKMPFREATQRAMTRQDESDLLNTTSNHDFITDTLFSGKQLLGMHGFLLGLADPGNRKVRFESADKLSSFKRAFWDSNIGGLGGGIMEISRRFFPHDDHSWTEINPIRNRMPDWMPERFKTGDPYSKLPKGEMRLPGAGYEDINKLHSDEFGRYGALDRMKILGDIAPWSEEYKLWRDVAKKTVVDEAGKKEMKSIKERVEKQSRAHEFYNYKFLNNPTELTRERIESIEGTNITTTSGRSYSMAGVKLSKNADLSQYLSEGMSVQMEHLKKDKGANGSINAAVYVDGANINKELVRTGQAKANLESAMGAQAMTGDFGKLYGKVTEAIAHAPIPFVHNKIMRVDTALESYKNEKVYGTPYSTWDHPIRGFITPSLQKTWGRGAVGQALAIGSWALAESVWANATDTSAALKHIGINVSETGLNKMASTIFNLTNPGAFVGSMMASIPNGLMENSEGIKGLLSSAVFGAGVEEGIGRTGARLGATAMLAGYAVTRSDKPLQSIGIFSMAGVALSKQLKMTGFGTKEGAIAGAATGLLISSLRNPSFDKEKMFGKHIPKITKRRWDLEEYYDRLEYVKYQGLYQKAARKAKFWEGVDIRKVIAVTDAKNKTNKKKIEKLNNRLNKISNSRLEGKAKEELINRINSKLYELKTDSQVVRGGKYTKAAIAYKQAADSTIYGLKEDAKSIDVLRAIPKGDKDFFMEFAKEKNEKKQNEILKFVSPYQRRALKIAWGRKDIDKIEENEEYFKDHFMPGVFWAGWSPQVDMEDVKIKTIENEGMMLSDFGIYESQSQEPAALMAPSVGVFDKANTGGLGLKVRLESALHGVGLIGTKVSVSPSSSSSIDVIANFTESAKITEYKVREGINRVIGERLFY